MKVILLEKINKLGSLGDAVTVKPGFARNYLMPQGKAVAASHANLDEIEKRRAELEKVAAQNLQTAQARGKGLENLVVTIKAAVSEEGTLYGSVGTREIADAVTAAGTAVNKAEVILAEGPLRQVGEHEVHIQLHADVNFPIKVNVVSDSEE